MVPANAHPANNGRFVTCSVLKKVGEKMIIGPHSKSFIVGSVLSGLVMTCLWFLLPQPKQMARSLLSVSAQDPFILFPKNNGPNFDMFKRAQTFLVKSRFVLFTAL